MQSDVLIFFDVRHILFIFEMRSQTLCWVGLCYIYAQLTIPCICTITDWHIINFRHGYKIIFFNCSGKIQHSSCLVYSNKRLISIENRVQKTLTRWQTWNRILEQSGHLIGMLNTLYMRKSLSEKRRTISYDTERFTMMSRPFFLVYGS